MKKDKFHMSVLLDGSEYTIAMNSECSGVKLLGVFESIADKFITTLCEASISRAEAAELLVAEISSAAARKETDK